MGTVNENRCTTTSFSLLIWDVRRVLKAAEHYDQHSAASNSNILGSGHCHVVLFYPIQQNCHSIVPSFYRFAFSLSCLVSLVYRQSNWFFEVLLLLEHFRSLLYWILLSWKLLCWSFLDNLGDTLRTSETISKTTGVAMEPRSYVRLAVYLC